MILHRLNNVIYFVLLHSYSSVFYLTLLASWSKTAWEAWGLSGACLFFWGLVREGLRGLGQNLTNALSILSVQSQFIVLQAWLDLTVV